MVKPSPVKNESVEEEVKPCSAGLSHSSPMLSASLTSGTIETEYKSEIAEILKRYDDNKARKQALVGTVVSTKCAKSITVRVVHKRLVPKYNKFVSVQRRIMAHDEQSLGKMGDLVRIVPCRPMSRKKRHALIDIVLRPKSVVTEDGTVLSSGGNVSKR